MDKWKIEHRTIPPHYPQSNGLAESMVKELKHLIDKAIIKGIYPQPDLGSVNEFIHENTLILCSVIFIFVDLNVIP